MCIICVKKPGVNLPSNKTIERLWYRNPDGAGFMWAKKGGKLVHIRKGFMTLAEFQMALYSEIEGSAKDLAMVLHFRITTHGGTCAENTHPFEITSFLERLRADTLDTPKVCFAHNGVLPIKPKQSDISDTMEFARSRLMLIQSMDKNFLNNEAAMALIEDMSEGSRLAFLSPDGQLRTTGNFYEDSKTHLLYSNSNFLPTYEWPEYKSPRAKWEALQSKPVHYPTNYGFHDWDDEDELLMPWEH